MADVIHCKNTPKGWVVDPKGEPFELDFAARGVVTVSNRTLGVTLTLTQKQWDARPKESTPERAEPHGIQGAKAE